MPELARYLEIIEPDANALVNALLKLAESGLLSAFCVVPSEDRAIVLLTERDGRTRLSLERSRRAALLAKLKKLARLDVAQRRRPQRGLFRTTSDLKRLVVSVATRPATYGEIVRVRFRRA
jgi:type II secretory ATPase GspE/PulE/Tfp pilus assembly ATPase PilB-like protein